MAFHFTTNDFSQWKFHLTLSDLQINYIDFDVIFSIENALTVYNQIIKIPHWQDYLTEF